MELIIGIALLLLAGYLYFQRRARKIVDDLPEADPEEAGRAIEENEREIAESREKLQQLLVYRTLRNSVTEGMTLDQLIDAFQKMCELPVGDPDNLLFETGTYHFTGEKMFHFSLVRQFQFLDEDEYVQLHLEALYTPGIRTFGLRNVSWDARIEGDFFEYVKNSPACHAVKELPIAKIEVWIDET